MPKISWFRGISIGMYYSEHSPPHFHVEHGSDEAVIEIETGRVHGRLPRSSLRYVMEWRKLHLDELRRNWDRARTDQPLLRIDPLR